MTQTPAAPETALQPAVVRDLRPVPPEGRAATRSSSSPCRRAARGMHGRSAESVAEARRFVRRTLTRWALPDSTVEDAELVASEFVTNAVTHARSSRILVHVSLTGAALLVTVVDRGPYRPFQPRQAAHEDEHGRGLQIVEAVADKWGQLPLAPGTAVWARLTVPTDTEVTQ